MSHSVPLMRWSIAGIPPFPPSPGASGGIIQRKCASCEEEAKPLGVQRKASPGAAQSENDAPLAAEETSYSGGGQPSRVPTIVHEVLGSPGQPLDPGVRMAMETRFASGAAGGLTPGRASFIARSETAVSHPADPHEREADRLSEQLLEAPEPGAPAKESQPQFDFSRVRIHTGDRAARSAKEIGARAYTAGHQIVFAAGQYAPETASGQRLLLHELVHTVQQGGQDGLISRDCAGHPEFCTPYATRAQAIIAKNTVAAAAVAYINSAVSNDAARLWQTYLNRKPGDSLTPYTFTDADSVGKSFASSKSTDTYSDLQEKSVQLAILKKKKCHYVPVNSWIDIPVRTLLSQAELEYPLDFGYPRETPGNIAGGVGSSDAGPDLRLLSGHVSLTRMVDSQGITTGGKMKTHFHMYVKDAIDLCPGDCGTWLEQLATVTMSRIEATGEAYDVPFEVNYDLPVKEVDVHAKVVEPCAVAPTPGSPAAAGSQQASNAEGAQPGEDSKGGPAPMAPEHGQALA